MGAWFSGVKNLRREFSREPIWFNMKTLSQAIGKSLYKVENSPNYSLGYSEHNLKYFSCKLKNISLMNRDIVNFY